MERFTSTESLHDQILAYTGKDLPNGTGLGLSIDAPDKVLAHENYGYTEVDNINLYLRDYETVALDVLVQEIMAIRGKLIDSLELSVSESYDDMKDAGKEKYYFDVTEALLENI